MAGSTVRAAALAPAALVAVLVVPAMLGAEPAAHARSDFPHATPAAAPCAKQTKKLKAFKRAMPKVKRRFFRTHTSAAQRRKFVQKQKRKLAQLKRARARCLERAKPKPGPPPPGGDPPPGGGPPSGGGPPPPSVLSAIDDVITDDAFVSDAEITDGVVRTQIQLVFRPDATAAAMNDLLTRLGARIVSSRAGVAMAVVEIPDPGDLEDLEALLASLDGEPALRDAVPVFMPPEDELPSHIDFGTTDTAFVRSQAAVRAPAAWNARAALAGRTPPRLVVADHFGDGPPGIGLDAALPASDLVANPRTSDHGYMVLGIIAGAFDGVGAPTAGAEAVTGMFPGRLTVRAADITSGLAGAVLHDRMLELVEGAPGDVVMNTSLSGWPCETEQQADAFCTAAHAAAAGAIWAEKVRGTAPGGGTSLEGKFLHTTSAGNVEPVTGAFGAALNSEWSASALQPLGIPNLTNTLVVGNHSATTTEPFRPGCLAPSSEAGGTIAGVGMPVHSFDSPTAARTFTDGGTSAATPQVAGLAAYVWALKPSLTPAQLSALLRNTARGECEAVIDAYAALLAADVGNASRPVRTAILDVADAIGDPGANGRFDGWDLDGLLAIFQAENGEISYGRGDLNGDGVIRGNRRDRFDLDVNSSYGTITQDIEGLGVSFDEGSLTDENVLCHSAYSPLWQGPLDERREKLGLGNCVDVQLDDTFPDQVTAGDANTLTITASSGAILDQSGDPLPVEDVFLELTPSDGLTLGADSGFTNADGVFTTTATLAEGETALAIDVTAFDREGGEELASDTVTATVVLPGTATIDAVQGELQCRAGTNDDDKIVDSTGDWSLSCSASGDGATATVSASASEATDAEGVIRYTGSGTISSASSVGLIASYVTVTVSDGPVEWFLTENMTGTVPPGGLLAGCYVNGQFVGITGGARGGVLEPGTHQIDHNCGGTGINATMNWTLTLGD